MKVYKLTVMVIDRELGDSESVAALIENANYPNDCISPSVLSIEEAEIGEWSDDHPLNKRSTKAAEFARLFP